MGAHNVNIYAQYANYITNTSIMGTSREVEGTIACWLPVSMSHYASLQVGWPGGHATARNCQPKLPLSPPPAQRWPSPFGSESEPESLAPEPESLAPLPGARLGPGQAATRLPSFKFIPLTWVTRSQLIGSGCGSPSGHRLVTSSHWPLALAVTVTSPGSGRVTDSEFQAAARKLQVEFIESNWKPDP